jgi:hypothetical protein
MLVCTSLLLPTPYMFGLLMVSKSSHILFILLIFFLYQNIHLHLSCLQFLIVWKLLQSIGEVFNWILSGLTDLFIIRISIWFFSGFVYLYRISLPYSPCFLYFYQLFCILLEFIQAFTGVIFNLTDYSYSHSFEFSAWGLVHFTIISVHKYEVVDYW